MCILNMLNQTVYFDFGFLGPLFKLVKHWGKKDAQSRINWFSFFDNKKWIIWFLWFVESNCVFRFFSALDHNADAGKCLISLLTLLNFTKYVKFESLECVNNCQSSTSVVVSICTLWSIYVLCEFPKPYVIR